MRVIRYHLIILFVLVPLLVSSQSLDNSHDYPFHPVPFTQVHFNDLFWAPRLEQHRLRTLPYTMEQCQSTGRVKNFAIAAGEEQGSFCTAYPFDDSDLYKIIEGASYSLQVHPDPVLDQKIDDWIALIGAAQEADGYLYTTRTIDPDHPHAWAGAHRWDKTEDLSHELYNAGHLFEAAAAHYQATGSRSLLDIAVKFADLIDREFGWGKIEKCPGHQVIETGLAKLYRITGEKRYLDLAKFFLDVRGPNQGEYSQAHLKVIDQTEAVGHAVRAAYMYSGMADIAALTGNQDYITAIDKIWEDVVSKKIYITGGIGATGAWEGFGPAYALPNFSAYCETCASIANVFWNYRLFLLHGDSKYIDVLERTLYNAANSGMSLEGDRFFYANPLEARKNQARSPWFSCACCPSNVARFFPSIPGYQYAVQNDQVYVNLFIGGKATIRTTVGELEMVQKTRYPWDGQVDIQVTPHSAAGFTMKIRIPGWARGEVIPSDLYTFTTNTKDRIPISVNGDPVDYTMDHGYATITRRWESGDRISIEFPMEPRFVRAHPSLLDDAGKLSIERGPLVYCLEGQDQPDEHVINCMVPVENTLESHWNPSLLNGVVTVSLEGAVVRQEKDQSLSINRIPLLAIPYYAWANRERNFMAIWMSEDMEHTTPMPAPSIASASKVQCSAAIRNLDAIHDQYLPEHANDHTNPYLHFWPRFGTEEWVQYDFSEPSKISSSRVYWFDDGPDGGCRIPASWRLQYLKGDKWKDIKPKGNYPVSKDAWDEVQFKPVSTTALRLILIAQPGVSTGIHEWEVQQP